MKPEQILERYDLEMRRDPPGGKAQVHRRDGLTLLSEPPPSPFSGWVLYTRLNEAGADEAIRSVIDFFRPLGGEFEWKTYDHDTPADLRPRLERFGFQPDEVEALLALDLEQAPPGFWDAPQTAVEVRPVVDPADLNEISRIQVEVWNEPFDDLVEYLSELQRDSPSELSIYLAYADGMPASCAWIRFYPRRSFAELYGGSTLEAYRGRGLYKALVAARAAEARRRGVRFLAVDASPMSRPILERIGFQHLVGTQPFVWKF